MQIKQTVALTHVNYLEQHPELGVYLIDVERPMTIILWGVQAEIASRQDTYPIMSLMKIV